MAAVVGLPGAEGRTGSQARPSTQVFGEENLALQWDYSVFTILA